MKISITSHTGKNLEAFFEPVARLRLEVFKEFPYLYDGSLEEETAYLSTFFKAENSVLVLAKDKDEIIGASTALPMIHETANVQEPFLKDNWPMEEIFYFGESVLKANYRGNGIGVEFFNQREAFARSLAKIKFLTFCAVKRPHNHSAKPKSYQDLSAFWKKRGFQPTDMYCEMVWKDLNEISESPKPLKFWIKKI